MRDATTADLPKTAMRQRNPEPGVQRHAAYQVHPPHTVPHRSCRRGQPANVVGGFLGGVGVYKEPPGAWCSTGGPCDGECGGVLLSHILSGAVPSPCQALASGFGMGPGVSPGPWPPQIFNSSSRPHGDGGWFRVAVREPEDGRDVSLFRAS